MNFNINDRDFSIWLSENISDIENNYYKNATQNKCYLCGNSCTSFCNSHSIPQFVLENLGDNGIYSNYSDVADIDILKHFTGKKRLVHLKSYAEIVTVVFLQTMKKKKYIMTYLNLYLKIFYQKLLLKIIYLQ